jgi:hypothetical protein
MIPFYIIGGLKITTEKDKKHGRRKGGEGMSCM